MKLERILCDAISHHASDVHLMVGMPPTMRVNGLLETMAYDKFSSDITQQLIYECLVEEQIMHFEQNKELNVSFNLKKVAYFRMNVYYRMGNVEAAIRIIPIRIPSLEQLGLPHIVKKLTRRPNGLILITGAAGMGKTTTMTAMIDCINRDDRRSRVITIEDPVEYVHSSINSVIIQREVGKDTRSFNEGLRQALRQDPNCICIGEMRDLETISIALTAAETGHLVLATLHSSDTIVALDRIVDVFPQGQQEWVRMQLAGVLQGIISQRLLPRIDKTGRALALEILITNSAVRHVIRNGDTNQLNGVILTGGAEGMVGLDRSLATLYRQGIITYDVAIANAKDFRDFMAQTRI